MANLTSKELSALEDQIGQEQLMAKKYQAMSGMCQNQQIKQCLTDHANQHQQYYNTLMTFLQ